MTIYEVDVIIFDLDGTLVDSQTDISFAVNATLRKFGMETIDPKIIARYVGFGVRPLLAEVAQKYPSVSVTEFFDTFEHFYAQHLSDTTRLYSGMAEVLDHFSAKKLFVLTNKKQKFTDSLLSKIDLARHFKGMYGRDAFAKHKPDPMGILAICNDSNTPPARALMVGDTEIDIFAGQRAGARTCGVTYGYGDPLVLKESKPDLIIDHPEELLKFFS